MPSAGVASGRSSSSAVPVGDVAIEIPQTPDVFAGLPATPRTEPTTRLHDVDTQEDHEAKRAKTESLKKQRIERIAAEHAGMIRTVKISNESFHTMEMSTAKTFSWMITWRMMLGLEKKKSKAMGCLQIFGILAVWPNNQHNHHLGWTDWLMKLS